MRRRSGRWIALFSLIVIGGLVALVVTGRGALQEDSRQVNERWAALRAPLAVRYDRLAEATAVVEQAGGERAITTELSTALRAWDVANRRPSIDAQVAAANDLEGLSRRLTATVAASVKLRTNADVTAALDAFAQSQPNEPLVDAFDDATTIYAQDRTSVGRRLAASLFGYEARPALRLA